MRDGNGTDMAPKLICMMWWYREKREKTATGTRVALVGIKILVKAINGLQTKKTTGTTERSRRESVVFLMILLAPGCWLGNDGFSLHCVFVRFPFLSELSSSIKGASCG